MKRTAYVVEASDIGKVQTSYLGQSNYTFEADDEGRLIEVVQNVSPNFISWWFGSSFAELREQYPDPKPYMGAPSAQE
ncbi:MAG: hypothetical protein DI616_15765 [Paracoccus denitrificans]|uniref:Uncharacterized protein n=1 Tax=Paracoccus denitrificans TaxID=266 RepID=A0A533I2A2_PARDE|nr:MAG: hypothetical protein DI616_15765 [Paracoccus denitrificans]